MTEQALEQLERLRNERKHATYDDIFSAWMRTPPGSPRSLQLLEMLRGASGIEDSEEGEL